MECDADSLLDYMWHYSFCTSQSALKSFLSQKQPMSSSNPNSAPSFPEGPGSGSRRISRNEFLHTLESFPQLETQTVLRGAFDALDEDHDGQISVLELNRQMGRLGFQLSHRGIVEIVESVDANHDGALDYPEFCSLNRLFVTPPLAYVNGEEGSSSSSISRSSSSSTNGCRWNEKTALSVVDVFAVFDKDGDGFISAADLRDALICMNMIKAEDPIKCEVLIERVDTDGDGKVSLSDFQNMLGM